MANQRLGWQRRLALSLLLAGMVSLSQGAIADAAELQGASEQAPALPSDGGAQGPEPGQGWIELFDGVSLDGWRNYGGEGQPIHKWRVEEGVLALAQPDYFDLWLLLRSWLFGGASGDLIYYREKFQNFELSLEWKIEPGGNSGIFYLVADEERNAPWITGIEMQVLDNEGHPDGVIPSHRAGSIYDLVAADPQTARPPGEWNAVRLKVQGQRIEHWLNGALVASVERGSKQWDELLAASKFSGREGYGTASAGYIVLQDHGDRAWYRNIRVRPLTAH